MNTPVPPIAELRAGLPRDVDRVFQRALAKGPRARYGSAREFVAELGAALERTSGPTAVLPRATARRRRRSPMWYLLPVALLLATAVAGAIVAAVVSGGDSTTSVLTRTVTGRGATTTVGRTVTQSAAPQPPPPPLAAGADGHSLNDQGFSLMKQGVYSSALPLLQQAVRKLAGTGPGDRYEGYANYNLGYTLYRLGRCSEAVTYLKRAEKLEPERSEPKAIRKQAQHC